MPRKSFATSFLEDYTSELQRLKSGSKRVDRDNRLTQARLEMAYASSQLALESTNGRATTGTRAGESSSRTSPGMYDKILASVAESPELTDATEHLQFIRGRIDRLRAQRRHLRALADATTNPADAEVEEMLIAGRDEVFHSSADVIIELDACGRRISRYLEKHHVLPGMFAALLAQVRKDLQPGNGVLEQIEQPGILRRVFARAILRVSRSADADERAAATRTPHELLELSPGIRVIDAALATLRPE